MTITDVCNMALDILDSSPIDTYASTPDDMIKRLRRLYPMAARRVLVAHDWKEAVKWETVVTEAVDSYTSHNTENASASATAEMTAAIDANTPRRGTITFTKTGETDDDYKFSSWTGAIFTLDGVTLDQTFDNTWSVEITPNNRDDQYEYMYDLPSTNLRVLDINNDKKYIFFVEGDYLFTNEYDATYGVRIRYVKDIRDEVSSVVLYGEHIGRAIAAELAYWLAPRKKRDLVMLMRDEAMVSLSDAIAEDTDQKIGNLDQRPGTIAFTDM